MDYNDDHLPTSPTTLVLKSSFWYLDTTVPSESDSVTVKVKVPCYIMTCLYFHPYLPSYILLSLFYIFTCLHFHQLPVPSQDEHIFPPDWKSGNDIQQFKKNHRPPHHHHHHHHHHHYNVPLPIIWTNSPFGLIQEQPGRCLWFFGRTSGKTNEKFLHNL